MKKIYFTFDDGPSDTTEQLLSVLKKHGVKACFFVTNEFHRPELIRTIAADGHTVALHSYTHSYETVYASAEAYFADLEKIDGLVYETLGFRSKLVRLPGGTHNTVHKRYCPGVMEEITAGLRERGYRVLDWDCDNCDGVMDDFPAEVYVRYFLADVTDGEERVFLSHNRPQDAESVRSVDRILSVCEERGWEIGRIEDYAGPAANPPEAGADPYLMLVNREARLRTDLTAGLKVVKYMDIDDFPVRIERETLTAYLMLRQTLSHYGITIGISSAFRSVSEQKEIWDMWLKRFDGCAEKCMQRVALPWMSEHHTGMAFDFLMMRGDAWPDARSEPDYDDARFRLIHGMCHRFGLIVRYPRGKEAVTGYQYEPWHLRYVGTEPAAEMYEKGLTLEEYIALRKQRRTETHP